MGLAFVLTLASLLIVVMVRNGLVYRYRVQRLDEIHAFNVSLINQRQYEFAIDYDGALGSYDGMLFDVRKWTFKQFYPTRFQAEALS